MNARVVTPRAYQGMNMTLLQIIGKGPKFTIACGGCPGTFEARIPQIDRPTLACPYCGSFNRLDLEWSSA